MEHMMSKLSENILDKFSMDFLRNQVLKNAYGNDDTIIAALDPRILIAWYLFFGVIPWFVNDLPFLLGSFVLVMVTTLLARVAGLVLFLFALGVFSQTGYLHHLPGRPGDDGGGHLGLRTRRPADQPAGGKLQQ